MVGVERLMFNKCVMHKQSLQPEAFALLSVAVVVVAAAHVAAFAAAAVAAGIATAAAAGVACRRL